MVKKGFKECPYCAELIREKAIYCRFCNKSLVEEKKEKVQVEDIFELDKYDTKGRESAIENLLKLIPKQISERVLESAEVIEESERRLITILFADLCGYTSLSEVMDPEEVQALMGDIFEPMLKIAEKYGGTVSHFLGDAIMAYYGAPMTHEDDPERAIRTALEIVDSVRAIGKERELDLEVSIGINCGEVVVGGIPLESRKDYSAFGDAVNTASRLESLAGPGEILVSDRIYKQVKDKFEFERRPPTFVKNKREPVQIYKVIGVRKRPIRTFLDEASLLTKFVGRKKELSILQKAYDELSEKGAGLVEIAGDPGVGKSRLLYEFIRKLDEEQNSRDTLHVPNNLGAYAICPYKIYSSRCLSFGTSIPYYLIVELLKDIFELPIHTPYPSQEGISDDAQISGLIKKKLEELIHTPSAISRHPSQEGISREDIYNSIAFLLSIKEENPIYKLSPKERCDKIFKDISTLLIHLHTPYSSQEGIHTPSASQTPLSRGELPLIYVFEDLQWIDELSLQLLDYFISRLSSEKILLFCISRKVFVHRWSPNINFVRLELEELSAKESAVLLNQILGIKELPTHIAEVILTKTEGNPFFVEEVIKAFIEDGTIVVEDGQYKFTKEIEDIKVPDSVQGVIMSRIDSLEAKLRRVIQCASVIGHGFRYKVLSYIMEIQEKLKEYLSRLIEGDFIYQQSIINELLYLFRHIVTQEVAYNTLLLKRRKHYHRKIGECLEDIYPEDIEENYEILAHHFYHSDNDQKAAYYLDKASEKYEMLYANEALIDTVNKLIEVIDKRLKCPEEYHESKVNAYIKLGRVKKLIGKYDESIADYSIGIRFAGDYDFKRSEAICHRNIADLFRIKGQYENAFDHLKTASGLFDSLNDESEKLTCQNSLGVVFQSKGEYDKSIDYFNEGIRLAEKNGNLLARANATNNIGVSYQCLGDYENAIKYFELTNEMMIELDNRRGTIATLTNIGICLERLGEFENSLKRYAKSLQIAEDIGFKYAIVANLLNMGQCHQYLGDQKNAIKFFSKAIKLAKEDKDLASESMGYGNIAKSYIYSGNDVEAFNAIQKGEEIAEKSNYYPSVVNVKLAKLMNLIKKEDYKSAVKVAEETIKQIEEKKDRDNAPIAYRLYANVLNGLKNCDVALKQIDKAIEIAKEDKYPREIAWALMVKGTILENLKNKEQAKLINTEAKQIATSLKDKTLLSILS